MSLTLSDVQRKLLNDWQRHFPLCPEPYAVLAKALGISVNTVLQELAGFMASGIVSRVGPVFRPHSVGVSTLVAAAVPEQKLEAVANIISSFDEVNHNYEREHTFNLWFVVTASNPIALQSTLDDIEHRVGYCLLRLPMIKHYHIDLGFRMALADTRIESSKYSCGVNGDKAIDTHIDALVTNGMQPEWTSTAIAAFTASPYQQPYQQPGQEPGQQPNQQPSLESLVESIQAGLPLVERPYRAIARRLGSTEQDVIVSISRMVDTGTIKRLGIVVRHKELGYRANAMVVWDLPDDQLDAIGEAMGAREEVTLCYQRPRIPGRWPYNLFCMVHGRDRDAVIEQIQQLAEQLSLVHVDRCVLFSGRRFKQRGARYHQSSSREKTFSSGLPQRETDTSPSFKPTSAPTSVAHFIPTSTATSTPTSTPGDIHSAASRGGPLTVAGGSLSGNALSMNSRLPQRGVDCG